MGTAHAAAAGLTKERRTRNAALPIRNGRTCYRPATFGMTTAIAHGICSSAASTVCPT